MPPTRIGGLQDCKRVPNMTTYSDFIAIAASQNVSMGLRSNGEVVVAGYFGFNQGRAYVPAEATGVKAIATSGQHCLALKDDGKIVAWGSSEFGGLSLPPDLDGVTGIVAGYGVSAALLADGTAVTWGDRSNQTIPRRLGLGGLGISDSGPS